MSQPTHAPQVAAPRRSRVPRLSLPPVRARVHPLVTLAYRFRLVIFPLLAATIGSAFWGREAGPVLWAALGAYAFVLPHLHYQVSRRSPAPRRVELGLEVFDAGLGGLWVGLAGFGPWPATVYCAGYTMTALSIGGVRQLGWVWGALLAGGAVAGVWTGFAWTPDASHVTTLVGSASIIVLMTGFGFESFAQGRRLVATRRLAEEQKSQIARQAAELADAKDAAEEARATAEEASRAKSVFLANMSHELRTPLNAIIGYSEILEEDAGDLTPQDRIARIRKIGNAGRHLLTLINGVLDLSKIEAGRVELHVEPVGLAQLVDDVVGTVEPLAAGQGNTVTVRTAPDLGTVHVDAMKLRQVLLNLLSNACKFTESGTIEVEADRVSREAGDEIVIVVRDSGIGMSSDQLSRLFQSFSQADGSTTRKFGGTGLGLVISRKFCRMMGGDITATSREGAGSAFTVRLPAVVDERGRASSVQWKRHSSLAGRRERGAEADPTVLLVEPDEDTRALLTRALEDLGFRSIPAAGAAEAVHLARGLLPDVVLTGLALADGDGWAVLRQLGQDPQLAELPVIVVSDSDDGGQAREYGAAGYLVKPVAPETLRAALAAVPGLVMPPQAGDGP